MYISIFIYKLMYTPSRVHIIPPGLTWKGSPLNPDGLTLQFLARSFFLAWSTSSTSSPRSARMRRKLTMKGT